MVYVLWIAKEKQIDERPAGEYQTVSHANAAAEIAKAKGYKHTRIYPMDLNIKPDFSKAILNI